MSEVAGRVDFGGVRYGQVWEDADVLLEALEVGPEDECLAIASAGDNALAMLARGPRRVVAVDLSRAQLACLDLRVAAFRELGHGEVLELVGSVESGRREELYGAVRGRLGDAARAFWDQRMEAIRGGIGGAGKFENYFRIFRERVLPLVHGRRRVAELLVERDRAGREAFYATRWDTWRWRMMFRGFFSRTAMGRLGRDPEFFRYVEGSVAERILGRTRHALTELAPHANPYLQWILTGRHGTALPFYLRAENFAVIRANLDRLEWIEGSVEDVLDGSGPGTLSKFNLSDIFEYMSDANAQALLERLAGVARPGGRVAYWNMLVPRSAGALLRDRLVPLDETANALHRSDKAFFYSRFVVEEVRG